MRTAVWWALRRLGTRRRDDSGFTLVEMLTVTVMLTIVTAVAFGALFATRGTVTGTVARFDQVQQAKSAVEAMTRTLHSAVLPRQVYGTCTACTSAVVTAEARTLQL
jgi:prepilin-type N-terminal cleavage/methylation domain-containing protein